MKKLNKIIKLALLFLCLGTLSSCTPTPPAAPGNDDFRLKATVSAVGDRIEVEVYDSDYAFGTYLVITDATTTFLDENGRTITKTDLNVGDRIEIFYGGQTMQSYPPQIFSPRIVKLH